MAEKMGRVGFGAWGFILGAIVAITVGFWGFNWKTAGQVEEVVVEQSLPAKSALCAQNFLNDPNFDENLAALKANSSWSRDSFIRDEGEWAVMPGETSANRGVAGACYRLLQEQLDIE